MFGWGTKRGQLGEMKTALLIDAVLLILVCFFDWLFPRAGERTRKVFEDWWLHFSALDHSRVGGYLAGLLTRRMDATFGARLFGLKYLLHSFFLSQCVFAILFLWIAISWGVLPVTGIAHVCQNVRLIVRSLSHCIVPLLLINTLFDILSLAVTRHILRKAAVATTIRAYTRLLCIDFIIAVALVLVCALFFSNFYFSPDMLTATFLFFVYLGFVPAGVFLIVGPVFFFISFDEKEKDPGMRTICVVMLVLAAIIAWLAVKNSFYTPYLSLDTSDLTVVLILAVSLTAAIPTALNLVALLTLALVRSVSGPTHTAVSHVLLRLAETPRGLIYVCIAVLVVIKDALRAMK